MDDIRKRALKVLADQKSQSNDILDDKNVDKIIHELKVHQIELEIQNEDLLDLQRELEKSRNHYFNLFHNAPVGYVLLSKAATIIDANDTFAGLVGRTLEELKNSYFIHLLESNSKEIFLGRFNAIFKSPEGKNIEVKIEKGSKKIYLNLKGEKIKNFNSDDENLFLSVTDITERKKNQDKIDHLNRVLKSVRNIDKLISHEKDKDHLLLNVVEILATTRGYQNVWIALYNKNFKEMTHFYANKSNQKVDKIKKLLKADQNIYCVKKAKKTNGVIQESYNEKECTKCPLGDDENLFCTYTSRMRYNGEVYGIISAGLEFGFPRSDDEKKLFSEIVDELSYAVHSLNEKEKREELMENLQYERDLVTNIMNTTPSGIAVVNKDGAISYLNYKAKEILNVSEIDGEYSYNDKNFKITDYDGNPFSEENLPFNQVKKTKKTVQNIRHAIHRDNGDVIMLSISSSPIFDKNKNFDGIISVINDVTKAVKNKRERIKLEKEAARSQRLETIGTLAGGIAHDFNNILTPIVGYSDMILNGLRNPDMILENVQDIYDAAIRARDLVAQILSFSRNDEQNREPIYIYPILKEALKLLDHSIPSTINIISKIDKNSKKILADSSKIHQVIMNLCTNAFHAMEDTGGTLFISLEQVEISQKESDEYFDLNPGEHLKITVKDTGVGIDPSLMDKIFEPFFTTKEVDKGTGLGLSVVHGIVKSHDGMIVVNTEPGKGSSFVLFFPVYNAKTAANFYEGQKELQKGSESILIVDDNEAVLKLSSKFLKSLGYSIWSVSSSREALNVYQQNAKLIDLLITDLTMPGMTGLDLSKQIHEFDKTLPILMMTGYGSKISKKEQVESGILKILTKPVLIHELSEFIREIFDEYRK